jgi:hypothetical protein
MIEIALAGLAAYGAYRICRGAWQHARESSQTRQLERQAAAQQRRQWQDREMTRRREAAKLQQAARLMQIAILQLQQSPDFRRAATFAKHAKDVPLSFRLRQFRRLRPLLVDHFAARLRDGASAEDLLPGLTELVTGLGVAAYEADYIHAEAEGQREQYVEQRPGFAGQMRQLQAEHEQRLGAIQSLQDLAPELREQLVESEQQRFRDLLLAAGDAGQSPESDRG